MGTKPSGRSFRGDRFEEVLLQVYFLLKKNWPQELVWVIKWMSHQINRTNMDYCVDVTYNIFEKKIWYIDFTFLGDDIVAHINVMILSLFFQLPISFPVLFCYSLVDMRVSLGTIFVLILIYLVSDRRELSLSKHKLENLFFFTCLI